LLLEDKRHRLWAVGERFLYLYTPEGMRVLGSLPLANDLGPVTCAAYNPHTDLLVLGHPRGLHTLDMALVDPVGVPPRLALTQAWVGDQAVNSADSLLRTNSAPQRVAFAFAVNSYVNEQLNLVQVRLQGYDEEWVTLGPDLKATFPQLPAGDYTLLARAVNADGLPSAPYTLLHIQVPAPFYLQGWFWLLGLLLATALGALVTRYIFQQRLRREQRKRQLAEALQRERERISRDLHDHMGAHLSYMLTRLNLMPHEDPQTQSLWKDLDGSLRTSMQHLRESIWALGAASITLPQLADRIRIFGQKRFLGTQTQFVLQLADGNPTIPTLKPDVALTLFRIAQEALNNAAKYAQAHKVTLSLTADTEQVTLSVADDGLGFDPQAPHMDSYGLSGMQARAQELGGSWLLESAPGRGTRIAVRLPI
jgi:signal transduction histidine kinase